jgi:hypothetical protein
MLGKSDCGRSMDHYWAKILGAVRDWRSGSGAGCVCIGANRRAWQFAARILSNILEYECGGWAPVAGGIVLVRIVVAGYRAVIVMREIPGARV